MLEVIKFCAQILSTRTISDISIKDKVQLWIYLKVRIVMVVVLPQSIHVTKEHGLALMLSLRVLLVDDAYKDVRNDLPIHSIDRRIND
jgi:hypothetical protein